MRIVRYETQDGKKPKYGWLLDDKVGEIGGNIFGRYQRKEAETPLADVRLLAPSEPTKILCVGRNYVEHAKELGNEVPKIPLIFNFSFMISGVDLGTLGHDRRDLGG